MSNDRKSKSAQIPVRIFNACEAEATKRRKRSGKQVCWTEVLFEMAEKALGLKSQQ